MDENPYQTYFELAITGVFFTDDESRFVDVNPKATEIFGVSRTKMIGMKVADFVDPEKLSKGEFELIRPDGKTRYLSCAVFLHFLPHLTLSIIKDITEEKKNRNTLALVTDRNNLLFETMTQGVVHQDLNGKIIAINAAAKSILGKTDQDFIENNFTKVDSDTLREDGSFFPRPDQPAMVAMRTGRPVRNVVMGIYNHLEKAYRWLNLSSVPLFRPDEKTPYEVYCVFDDITDSKKIAEEALQAKADFEATKNKAKFLDIAAHELRNPITAISLLLQIAENQIEKGLPLLPTVIKRLKAPSDRLNRLVTDLLDISRLEKGLIILSLKLTSLDELIQKCIEEFQMQATQRKFIFNNKSTPFQIQVDQVRMNQVLSNLLDNALKYTPENSPIEITIENFSKYARVSVIDQGPGIDPVQLKNIFRPFSRDPADKSFRSSGLGLGLTVCSGIIKLHHGKIEVQSELGQGCTFIFELPHEEENEL